MNAENQAVKEGAVEAESSQDRWCITELLDKGYTHREVKNMTGMSFITIGKSLIIISKTLKSYE